MKRTFFAPVRKYFVKRSSFVRRKDRGKRKCRGIVLNDNKFYEARRRYQSIILIRYFEILNKLDNENVIDFEKGISLSKDIDFSLLYLVPLKISCHYISLYISCLSV